MELQQTEESTKVRVSVVIPIRNEERYIQKCLDSVLEQDFPHDQWEINLVDGDSEDRTVELIQPYLDRYPFIHLYRNPTKRSNMRSTSGFGRPPGRLLSGWMLMLSMTDPMFPNVSKHWRRRGRTTWEGLRLSGEKRPCRM